VTALVLGLALVVALLGYLVVALLRSHAEVLRRLHEIDPAGEHGGEHASGPRPLEFGVRPGVALPRENATPAHDLRGTTPWGESSAVGVLGSSGSTLIAFLSSGCLTCLEFWRAFATDKRLPADVRLVVVTKGEEQESTSTVAELAPPGVTVLMSTQAWNDYEVPMAPYFILVDGAAGDVVGEGAASSWKQLVDLMTQARADAVPVVGGRGGAADRESMIDRELAAAGILPGHPSLTPDAGAFGDPAPTAHDHHHEHDHHEHEHDHHDHHDHQHDRLEHGAGRPGGSA
jgi:hypothetical protein